MRSQYFASHLLEDIGGEAVGDKARELLSSGGSVGLGDLLHNSGELLLDGRRHLPGAADVDLCQVVRWYEHAGRRRVVDEPLHQRAMLARRLSGHARCDCDAINEHPKV